MACIAALLCGTAAQLQGAALVKMLRARDSEWFVRMGSRGTHPLLFCGVRKVAIQALETKRAPPPPGRRIPASTAALASAPALAFTGHARARASRIPPRAQ